MMITFFNYLANGHIKRKSNNNNIRAREPINISMHIAAYSKAYFNEMNFNPINNCRDELFN